MTTTRRALDALDIDDVDLAGRPGIDLRDDPELEPEPEDAGDPVATFCRRSTPRPWTGGTASGAWAVDPGAIFDRAGNIGPTVWWDGEIVGSWATLATGEIRTAVLVDRGRQAADAVAATAAGLQSRLEGAVVTPAARTPLGRRLAQGS